jgi:HK97 family phage major capsid protein
MHHAAVPLQSAAETARLMEQRGKARAFDLRAKAMAATAGGRPEEAVNFLHAHHPRLRALPDFARAADLVGRAVTPGGTTLDPAWAGPLVGPLLDYALSWVAEIEPLTAFGKIEVTKVPSRVRLPRDTAELIATWVLEGRALPILQGSFDTVTLPHDPKLACGLVVTEELVRSSRPDAEALFSGKLRNAVARGTDRALLDPTIAASAETPASITNGVVPIPSSGVTPEAAAADFAALSASLTAAGLPFAGRSYITSPAIGEYLSGLRYPTGQSAFNVNAAGGEIGGVPVAISEEAGDQVVLVHGPSLLVSDDGAEVSATRAGTVEMADDPSSNMGTPSPAGAAPVLALWQNNAVGLKVLRYVNWVVARPGAVAVLSGFTPPLLLTARAKPAKAA